MAALASISDYLSLERICASPYCNTASGSASRYSVATTSGGVKRMKRVSMIFGTVLFVALGGIMVQRELAFSDRVGRLSDRVNQLESRNSDLLATLSELREELSGVKSTLQGEVQQREDFEADLVEWTDAANQLFRFLMSKPDAITAGSDPVNPCGPGSLGPFPNEDGELTCW